jgi:transposase
MALPYKPRDKAKAEVGVQIVERWILAKLRNMTFFSLSQLNKSIRPLVKGLNEKPFKKLAGNRRSSFETLYKPLLRPQPHPPYELAQWKKALVGIDYHVEVEGHSYSVPHRLIRLKVDIRLSANLVEVINNGARVAAHQRMAQKGGRTTLVEHMPRAHRAYQEWRPERLVQWAENLGHNTQTVVSHLLVSKPHPEQGFRSALGLVSLSRRYGNERLESACKRAVQIGGLSFKSIESILRKGLDEVEIEQAGPAREQHLWHENVRGANYYQEETQSEKGETDNDDTTDLAEVEADETQRDGRSTPTADRAGADIRVDLRGADEPAGGS